MRTCYPSKNLLVYNLIKTRPSVEDHHKTLQRRAYPLKKKRATTFFPDCLEYFFTKILTLGRSAKNRREIKSNPSDKSSNSCWSILPSFAEIKQRNCLRPPSQGASHLDKSKTIVWFIHIGNTRYVHKICRKQHFIPPDAHS